jgi:uncharacterized FAD-dependent dehydrogenase
VKFRKAIRKSLETRDIDLVLNDYIDTIPNPDEPVTKITTRKGKEITTDLVVSTPSRCSRTRI